MTAYVASTRVSCYSDKHDGICMVYHSHSFQILLTIFVEKHINYIECNKGSNTREKKIAN